MVMIYIHHHKLESLLYFVLIVHYDECSILAIRQKLGVSMKYRIKTYEKWYYNRSLKNIVSIYIKDVDVMKSINILYSLFKETVIESNVVLEFCNSNFENINSEVSEIISDNYEYIIANEGKYEYLYYHSLGRLFGVSCISKDKIDKKILERFIKSFGGIQIFGIDIETYFDTLLKYYHDTSTRTFLGDNLLKTRIVDSTILIDNDHNQVIISLDKSKFDVYKIIDKIKEV